MERECNVSVEAEAKDSNIFSRNPRITEILELICSHSETKKEIQSILLNFWDKYENCFSQEEDYCEFDVLGMYVLDYVYKRNGPTRSSVSRALYCYLKQINVHNIKQINLNTENRNDIISCDEECSVTSLREFTNFYSTKGEKILIDALIKTLLGGNLSLSQFLVKFGLVEFPSEANEKSRKIVRRLGKWFNSVWSVNDLLQNIPEEEILSIQFDNVFNEMEQNKNDNFRRLIFILCYICVIAEYRTCDNLEMRYNVNIKCICYPKLECLGLFIEMTTESVITLKDVDKYLSTILNQQLKEEVRTSLLEYARKNICEIPDYYNPRPLKHLVRSKIRESLQNATVLPEEVHQLPLPVALKEFVAFEEKDIWKALEIDQTLLYFMYKFNRLLRS